MLLLSKIIDRQSCGDADTEVLDEGLSFGKYMAALDQVVAPLPIMAEWEKAAGELRRFPTFLPPERPSSFPTNILGQPVFNDLYKPGWKISDGVLHVHFPVLGPPRSTEGVATDFAFLLLASYVSDEPEKFPTILEAWWPDGRVVRGMPERTTWEAAKHLFKAAQLTDRKRITGPACHRCLNQRDCRPWNALDEVLSLAPADKANAKTEAHRLWLEWLLLKDLDQKTELRKKFVSKRLLELAVNGSVDVNGLLKLNVQAQERDSYDITQVLSILQPAGLWKSEFASIKVGELRKAMPSFPAAVRAQLERIVKTEKIEPSLREAAAGTARSVYDVQTSPFIGLHLRS